MKPLLTSSSFCSPVRTMTLERYARPAAAALLTLFLITLLRTAWISDDAMITLRTLMNFEHGYGLRFNIDERVQAYTHPLWLFVLAVFSFVTGNIYTATFGASVMTSLVAFHLLLAHVGRYAAGALAAGLALLMSKAFIDYGTSGLENPLSHVLVLLGALFALRLQEQPSSRSTTGFFLICSLAYLSRPDMLVLLFPLAMQVGYQAWQHRDTRLFRSLAIGALPALAWTGFSIYYYGFPFPNTAYAKLGTGIELGERVAQGLHYLVQSLDRDPLTLGFIAVALVLGLRGSLVFKSLAAGMALHLAYIVSIGGDFMEGRFLTAPLIAGAVIVARSTGTPGGWIALAVGSALLGAQQLPSTLWSNALYQNKELGLYGIADERGYYFHEHGLTSTPKGRFAQPDWTAYAFRTEVSCQLGAQGLTSGPHVHLIDECGLSDPLLARMPAKAMKGWRIGHFYRQFPTDYKRSVDLRRNEVLDPAMRRYYESIRLITRGPLNHPSRLREILRINTGHLPVPDMMIYRTGFVPRVSGVETVAYRFLRHQYQGGTWDTAGNVQFSTSVEVTLDQSTPVQDLSLSVDGNDTHRVQAKIGNSWVDLGTLLPAGTVGMTEQTLQLPQRVEAVEAIRITVTEGDGRYALGHLRLN